MLQSLPEKGYGNMADVMRGYGEARDEEEDGGKRIGSKPRHKDAWK
jgi:hypothetical protein